jgi:hypothetical protein
MLRELGAVPVVADALDPDQVAAAVGKAKPDVIVHQLTALAGEGMRGLKRRIAMTNRLRSEGTDHLLSAGQAVGCGGSWRRATTAYTRAPAGR